MKSLICDAIRTFVLANKVVSSEQHGFILGRSILTNLLECVNDWTILLNRKVSVDVIYLVFLKAFDMVLKRRFLHKLNHSTFVETFCRLWTRTRTKLFQVHIGNMDSSL